jgi:hypothetical protein
MSHAESLLPDMMWDVFTCQKTSLIVLHKPVSFVASSKESAFEYMLQEQRIQEMLFTAFSYGLYALHPLSFQLLTPWKTVLLDKLKVDQPVKILAAFYGTRNLIIAFTLNPPRLRSCVTFHKMLVFFFNE